MTHINKPRIVIIMPYYLPGIRAGGPVRSIANLVNWLGDDFDFYILTSNHDYGMKVTYPNIEQKTWQKIGKARVRYLTPAEWSVIHLPKILSTIYYDLLYVDTIFAFSSILMVVLYRLNILSSKPLMIVPRGHLNTGAMKLKTPKKKLYLFFAHFCNLYRNVLWHASNNAEHDDILREISLARTDQIHIVSNLPSPTLQIYEQKYPNKVIGQLRIVFLSRITPKKNLLFALESLQHLQGDIHFDIYGFVEDRNYWKECQLMIQQLPCNIAVSYKGEVAFDKVADILGMYHVFYLPTLGENFGHVILEALCAGCPVLLSDQTPWNTIMENEAGWAFPLDQADAFVATLQKLVDMEQVEFNRIAENAANYGQNYIQQSSHVEAMQRMFETILERQ